jgi:hypothetical protein
VEARGKEERNRIKEANLSSWGGLSGQEGRTVRTDTADCPALCRGRSKISSRASSNEPWKIGLSAGCSRTVRLPADCPCLCCGLSKNRLQQKPETKTDRSEPKQEHEGTRQRIPRKILDADGPPEPRGLSARHDRTENQPPREVNSTKPSPDLPNRLSS